jgi:hypothetical protein
VTDQVGVLGGVPVQGYQRPYPRMMDIWTRGGRLISEPQRSGVLLLVDYGGPVGGVRSDLAASPNPCSSAGRRQASTAQPGAARFPYASN